MFSANRTFVKAFLIASGGVSITMFLEFYLVNFSKLGNDFYKGRYVLVIAFIYILCCQYNILRKYYTQKKRLEQEIILRNVSNSLFYNVLEADLSENIILGENTLILANYLAVKSNNYDEIIQAIVQKLVREDFQEEYSQKFSRENILKQFENKQDGFEYEFVERSDGANYNWIKAYVKIYRDCHKGTVRIISFVENIQKEKERELEYINKAQRDSLTNLYNKMVTQDLVSESLEKILPNTKHAIYLIDLDNFKNVNDNFGHEAGDLVLKQIAEKLKKSFRETDIVGRVGGDEFLVMLKNINDKEIVIKKAEEISTICREVIGKNEKRIEISLSIGICIAPLDGYSFEELYRKADQALYRAKSKGKNSFAFHTNI